MRVEESVDIARAPEEVWAFVAEPSNDPRLCRKVKAVEAAGPRRWRVLHKPVPLRSPVELTLEHVETEPPKRLTMREDDEASGSAPRCCLLGEASSVSRPTSGSGSRKTAVDHFGPLIGPNGGLELA